LDANTTQRLDKITSQLQNLAKRSDVDDFATIFKNLRVLGDESKRAAKQQNILRSLRFRSIKTRQETIKKAYEKTFKWIFEDTNSDFIKWLESGNGIYWIQGKAGSGKSTLMRYISEHTEIRSALKRWAETDQLFIGSHFFWNAGNSMQKSQEGLLRNLLYQIFREYPDLAEHSCSLRWSEEDRGEAESWSRDDLFEAFNKLSKVTISSMRFCFFIDGLDEYNGEHKDLIPLLHSLSSSCSIKICVSSRPWNIFVEAFGDIEKYRQLKLEDLTRNDIREYVQSNLEKHVKFGRLQSQDPSCNEVVGAVVKRAQGVFLWVFLVVESLLRGLTDGDDVTDMKRRLEVLPSDLEEYFELMLRKIDPFYRDETVRCFEIAVNALQPLPLLAFKFLEDDKRNQQFALSNPIQPIAGGQLDAIHETMKTRLNARCKDLLEVTEDFSNVSSRIFNYKVDFLHRTVRDFFLTTNTLETLRKQSSPFNVHMSLCRIMLALTKSLLVEIHLRPMLGHIFSLFDEFMWHARTLESRNNEPGQEARQIELVKLVDEMDRVNIEHTKEGESHWSNFRDCPSEDSYKEYQQKTFLASAIQANLTLYVRSKLLEDPRALLKKKGRPLLDCALRPIMVTPIELPIPEARPDVEMVRMLLEQNADPNQRVYIYDNQTVWGLFLRQCQKTHQINQSEEEKKGLYAVVELLVKSGARNTNKLTTNFSCGSMSNSLAGLLTDKDIRSLEDLLTRGLQNPSGTWNFSRFFRFG